jgi:RNA polymerase sigma-70 factor (ECF subfamily)
VSKTRTSLLKRVADFSDRRSWSEFVSLYEPLLHRYVRKQGLDIRAAEDVVQTIFVSLLRNLRTFELDHKRGRFRTWLWEVAHNAVIDWQRTANRHRRIRQKAQEGWNETTPEPPDEWITTYHKRILEFAKEKVRQHTAPTTWACFELHLLQGRAGEEVATLLGIPLNRVYVYASRVLARIRKQCAAYRKEFGDD